jgi:cytosine/adenosine deaminase-related metal-dependent hydrolase
MDTAADLVVRNAYVTDRDAVVDIAVGGGRILDVAPGLGTEAPTELDADGDLVSPGLVDAHVHLDMALSAYGERRPRNNDGSSDMDDVLRKTAAYFADASPGRIASNVRTVGNRAVANGVLHLRTHAYVDGAVGTDVVDAVRRGTVAIDDRLDTEVVAFPQQGIGRDAGSAAAVREAVEAGADLVGGLDPATLNEDRDGTIATWFDLAADLDVPIDVHVHEREATGLATLERLASVALDRGFEGRVTASHAFALADAATADEADGGDRLASAMDRFGAAGMAFVTCYQSTREGMPIRRVHDAGIGMAHGTDQAHDLWGAHGNVDALEAMLVESLKLPSCSTNDGLAALWELITRQGGRLLGLDGYGLDPGTPADLVVHDAASPHWAIIENPAPRYCLKDGRIVAADGQVVVD